MVAELRSRLYWAEAEFRRLGNEAERVVKSGLVADDGAGPFRERAKLVTAVTAMRARLTYVEDAIDHVERTGSVWRGLPSTDNDPRAVVEAYGNRIVELESFVEEAGLGDEREERMAADKERAMEEVELRTATAAASATAATAATAVTAASPEIRAKSNRDALLHHRRPRGARSGEDEAVMEQHRPVQEQMTSELVEMVGALKKNFQDMNGRIARDNEVLDETDAAVEQNLERVSLQNKSLRQYVQTSTRTAWTTYLLVLFAVLVTLTMIMFILAVRYL